MHIVCFLNKALIGAGMYEGVGTHTQVPQGCGEIWQRPTANSAREFICFHPNQSNEFMRAYPCLLALESRGEPDEEKERENRQEVI